MFGLGKDKIAESPVEFFDPNNEKIQQSPISFMDKDINTETSFAITKLTAGGSFMRGNMLYYKLKGVEVYTEQNNIIFVDTINNTLFIREYEKVINEIAPEDPENRQYILLYTDLGYEEADSGFPLRWESSIGRIETYENIKANISVIDVDKSIVLTENVAVKDALTVRAFVKYLQNADLVKKDDFDIDQYSSDYI